MDRKELLTLVLTWFQKFRKTAWFRVTYLVLLGLIVSELYVYTVSSIACLVVLVMSIAVFIVPYWLGERKMRRFVVNFLVVLVIAIVLAAAMSTQGVLAQSVAVPRESIPQTASRTMTLTNGTVEPYRGSPSSAFTFRVELTTTRNGTPSDYQVSLNLTVIRGLDETPLPHRMAPSPGNESRNPHNGTWYEARLSNLTDEVYLYAFSVWDRDKNWTFTLGEIGPLTASGSTVYGVFLFYTALSRGTFLAVVTYFALLFVWWYTRRARETRMQMLSRAPTSKAAERSSVAEPAAATARGRASKVAAFTCTNCGADVSESDTKCPSCGATFED